MPDQIQASITEAPLELDADIPAALRIQGEQVGILAIIGRCHGVIGRVTAGEFCRCRSFVNRDEIIGSIN